MASQRLRKQMGKLKRELDEHARAIERVSMRGRLSAFRPVGGTRQAWPPWAVALKGQPGCYVIRDARTRRVLYIGSAESNLYDTMTRHFQQWKRTKRRWKGWRGEGRHDPGMVYQRSECEVAIQLTEEEERREVEAALIHRFVPRDNVVEHPDGAAEVKLELAGEPEPGNEEFDEGLNQLFEGEEAPF